MHRDDHLLNCTFFFISMSLSISWLVQWSFSLLLLFSLCFFFSFSLCSFSSLSHIFISIRKKNSINSLLIVECSRSLSLCAPLLFERNGSSLQDKYTKFGNIHLFIHYAFISARPTFMLIAYFDCSCDVKVPKFGRSYCSPNMVFRWFCAFFSVFFSFRFYCCSRVHVTIH